MEQKKKKIKDADIAVTVEVSEAEGWTGIGTRAPRIGESRQVIYIKDAVAVQIAE